MATHRETGAHEAQTDTRTTDRAEGSYDSRTDTRTGTGRHATGHTHTDVAHAGHLDARDRFGGTNWGAAFFGWLVAVGLTILLTGIVTAIVSAIGTASDVTRSDAEREAGTIGIAAGIVLLVVLALAYYAGGYVAGRMSRFDGGRQGLAAWLIGLLVTLLAVGLSWVFGSEYNILSRVELPSIPLSTDELSWGGLIAAAAVLVVSLLAAMLGGKVGHRYHDKVDNIAHG